MEGSKEIMDNVHEQIILNDLCHRIINTPEFKRLKNLKQLGNSHEVYPTGNHSRFEHSLGVMHLAGRMCDTLRSVGAEVTEADKLCVEVAGLCHDLGHGPFSHLYEGFIRAVNNGDLEWEHEKSSIEILELIIEKYNIDLTSYGLDDKDLVFIKELIYGPMDKSKEGFPYTGRGPEKFYLYEIISNKISGVDVDKWDYFRRDSEATTVKTTFKYKRLFSNCKVVKWSSPERWNGVTLSRIAVSSKMLDECQEMFLDRSRLHTKVYQHRVVKKVDKMMVDVWILADPHYPKIAGRDGKLYSLSDAWKDVVALVKLTDDVVNQTIRHSCDPNMARARSLLQRIDERKLYVTLAEISEGSMPKKDFEYETDLRSTTGVENLCIAKRYIDMGKGSDNPVKNCLFYEKNCCVFEPKDKDLEGVAPKKLYSEALYILLNQEKPTDQEMASAKAAVEKWIARMGNDWNVNYFV